MDPVKRLRKPVAPCQVCFLHLTRCICHLIPSLKLRTRIALVVHTKELKRTTNTGRLALRALPNSEMFIRGETINRDPLLLDSLLTPNYRTLMFYPSDNARELTTELVEESPLPIQLIVPDGSWRQASKVHYRHHELAEVPRVKISAVNPATLHMRTENHEAGMATLEAIACALGIIEGEEVKAELMKFYQAKLEGTLQGRGQLGKTL